MGSTAAGGWGRVSFWRQGISPIECFGDLSDGIPDSASVAIGNRNKTNPRGVRGFGFGVRILSDPGKTLHRSSADPTILT